MSPKSVQRFWDNDMRKQKILDAGLIGLHPEKIKRNCITDQ
jgi:hypothetical protein